MGSNWRNGRRAHRTILWLVWAFRGTGNRRDHGRSDWRKRNRESRTGRLGNIPRKPCRGDRKAIYRADYDRDFPDERAVAAVRGRQKNCCPPPRFVLQSKLMDERHRAEEHLRIIRTLMERATIYRAISAPTALIGGLIALGLSSAIWASERHWAQIAPEVMRHISTRGFAALWLGALTIVLVLNAFFIWRKAQRDGRPFISPAMKLALRSILPCLIFPAATTIWFFCDGYEADT